MENKILLSICIPTYNGGAFLNENLALLVPMFKAYNGGDVEIIISNNASTDDTDTIIKYWLKECPSIIYIKRDENIGSMNNFSECVKTSNGEYVFLLGDDDVLCPEFINYVTKTLRDNPDIGLFHWNRIDYKMKNNRSMLFNNNSNTKYLKRYDDFSDFLRNHATMDSMSTIIFKKTSWFSGDAYVKENHYGYTWYARILNGAVNTPSLYCYYPLIIQRHPVARKWSNKQALYTCGLLNIYKDIDSRVTGVYEWIKNHYVMLSFENFINEMLIVSKDQKFYTQYYNQLTVHYGTLYKAILFSVLYVFPKPCSYILLYIVKIFVSLTRRLKR